MSAHIAGVMGLALGLCGPALAARKPRLGGLAAGLGMGVAFLGDGFLPLAMLLVLVLALPLAHPAWRTRAFAGTVAIALLCAAPVIAIWPLLLWLSSRDWLTLWLDLAATTR